MKNTHAVVRYAGDDYFVAVPPSGHAITLDVKGERSNAASPVELLMLGVGACTGADVISVLIKKRQQVTDYFVEVHSERREEHPRAFTKMEVRHILHGRAISADAVAKAVDLSMTKYCSVVASLQPTVKVTATFEIHEEAAVAAAPVA